MYVACAAGCGGRRSGVYEGPLARPASGLGLQTNALSGRLGKDVAMLSTVVLWMALARDKRGLMMVAAFLLLVVLAVIAWNLAP